MTNGNPTAFTINQCFQSNFILVLSNFCQNKSFHETCVAIHFICVSLFYDNLNTAAVTPMDYSLANFLGLVRNETNFDRDLTRKLKISKCESNLCNFKYKFRANMPS